MVLGASIVLVAAFYRPLTFWASNAWDLSDVTKVMMFGLATFLVGGLFYMVVVAIFGRPQAFGMATGLAILLLMHWQWLPQHVYLSLGAATVALLVAVGRRAVSRGLVGLFLLLVGVSPSVQVAIGHIQKSGSIPIVDLTDPEAVSNSGNVEDVLVVIADSYPAVSVAQSLGHDSQSLVDQLKALGYTVPEVGWSQHTFTTFSVSSLLELQPVVEAGSEQKWNNSKNLHEIMRGESLVVDALQAAGFEYTHVEGGLDHTSCGNRADVCVTSPWLDEITWLLLEPSVVGGALEKSRRAWFPEVSFSTRDELMQLQSVFGDGSPDYVFAHLLLPHDPFVLEEDCSLVPVDEGGDTPRRAAISDQLACTDRLLLDIASIADDKTAVLITGDHGLKLLEQITRDPEDWTEADIADAFAVLVAYKLPDGCDLPPSSVNTMIMTAIMECAVGLDGPPNDGGLLIGLHEYRWVGKAERLAIEEKILNGEIADLAG